jgi:hypothetical protein
MIGWLAATARADGSVDRLIAPLEALAILRRDLDVRLHDGGVGSVRGAIEAHDRLLRALASVSESELQEARARIDAMRARLTTLSDHLAALRGLVER